MANNNDRSQNHAQPGERGQGGDNLATDTGNDGVTTPAPAGGAGGQSGTGQATPHHGQQDPQGRAALNPRTDREGELPTPGNGPTYQSGGTQQDREQRDAERKVGEDTANSPANLNGAADPAPGKGGQNP